METYVRVQVHLGHHLVLEHALGADDTHLGILARQGGEERRLLDLLNGHLEGCMLARRTRMQLSSPKLTAHLDLLLRVGLGLLPALLSAVFLRLVGAFPLRAFCQL